MATLRARLTVAYGVALVGSVAVFSGALYVARRASSIDELGLVAFDEGDRALRCLVAAKREGKELTEERPCGEKRDSRWGYARKDMRDVLERVPGYFLVYDRDDRQIYSSIGIRQLAEEDRSAIDQSAVRLTPDGAGALVSLSDTLFGGSLLLGARKDPALLPNVTRVVAGVPTQIATLSPRVLVWALVLIFSFLVPPPLRRASVTAPPAAG